MEGVPTSTRSMRIEKLCGGVEEQSFFLRRNSCGETRRDDQYSSILADERRMTN